VRAAGGHKSRGGILRRPAFGMLVANPLTGIVNGASSPRFSAPAPAVSCSRAPQRGVLFYR
jgi:hypothetical protein